MKPSIVVGYDQLPQSISALDDAAAEADRREGVLTVVHAFQRASWASRPGAEPITWEAAHAAAVRVAELGAERVRSRHPGLEVRTHAAEGSTAVVLIKSARDADLLVIGYHRHVGDLGLGSVALRLATRPECPTMIVRDGRFGPRDAVLAAIDIDDPGEEVLAFAFEQARLRQTGLTAISIRNTFSLGVLAGDADRHRTASSHADADTDMALQRLLDPWQTAYPDVGVRREIADGSAGPVLAAASRHADLVVAGAHHHVGTSPPGGDSHPGPIVKPLLLRADCPVVIVPRAVPPQLCAAAQFTAVPRPRRVPRSALPHRRSLWH